MAQRILFKDSGLGNSNNPLSGYKFVGYNGLTFSQLDSDGNIVAISGSGSGNTFTSISITGGASAGYVLTSDSSGNAYWTASVGGGSLSGLGTTDYLSRWTGSSILGNSIIRENGSVIAIGITPSTLINNIDAPGSTYYFAINDTRNTEYSESLRINSLGGTYSKGLRISTENHYQSWGLLVQNKTKSTEQAYSIGTLIYGTGGGVNISNTIGRNFNSPAMTYDSNIFNFIANDFGLSAPTGAVINIYNENNASAANLYGIKTRLSGTVSGLNSFNLGCAYEANVSSRSNGQNHGLYSVVNGNSDYGNFGVYISTSHPSDNSKSYGIVVDSGKSIFNDGSNSYSDFQIKGDTNTNLFYVDASSDGIGIGTNTPDSKAILDLSSTTKGFLPPRMTADQANAAFGTQSTAPEGMLVYITATSSDPAVAECFFDVGWYGRQDDPGPGYFGSSGGFNWVKFGYYSYG
jgi:hypothetical protein